ncbi:cyclin-O protein A [Eurytemora carolleeae]|uniref:cyclin-O protein A n=1 Tax=Eurytemora carolleeae TaxID=1294199 RepID=UPI000C769676|nr:cyclin-O protein A [Eurytemora carolleeae]|eukprot:XP_023347514.1 cyclin-O protein A-like [Eurytemora affinis]
MAPYSLLFSQLSDQGLMQSAVIKTVENLKKEKKEKIRGLSTNMEPKVKVFATSAPSFFSMGPEEEVFDIELDAGLTRHSVGLTSGCSPVFDFRIENRGAKTPGPKPRAKAITPKAPKVRRLSQSKTWSGKKTSFKCEEVMEYAVDTYLWKRQLEPKYMASIGLADGTDVTAETRHTLLQWLSNIARQHGFSLETWCLSVNYLDRFLGVQAIDRELLQLAGVTSLLLAAKLEEQNPPEIFKLVKLCAASYSNVDFKHMEVIMLSKLNFMLLAPTASFLLNHLVQVRGEKEWPLDLSRHMVEMCLCMFRHMVEMCLCMFGHLVEMFFSMFTHMAHG